MDLFQFGRKYLTDFEFNALNEDHRYLVDKNTDLCCEIINLKSEYVTKAKLLQQVSDLNKGLALKDDIIKEKSLWVADLQAKLDAIKAKEMPESDRKVMEYFENKYPRAIIQYPRQILNGKTLESHKVDVRSFFMHHDNDIETTAKNQVVFVTSNDEKAYKIEQWIIKNVKYVPDDRFGTNEFWQDAQSTYLTGLGDCEDGAILLANMLVFAGVPWWRIRINAGSVSGGGHAYVSYCRETDNKFIVLDWCYFTAYDQNTPIADRPLHEDTRDYFGVWFSFNKESAFAKASYVAELTLKGFFKNIKDKILKVFKK